MLSEKIKNQIIRTVLKYEQNKLSFEKTRDIIKNLTNKKITLNELENYWKSENLEKFVDFITVKALLNWEEIDDDTALKLIEEILENIISGTIIERNGSTLEKRYSKPKGSIINMIFHEEITESKEILKRLKINTTIKV